MKPFCTGGLEDVERIAAANGYVLPQHRINPIWLRAPLAPYAAALVENRIVDVQGAKETYSALAKEFESVVVEGAGGLAVPITDTATMADLARSMGLPVLIVARGPRVVPWTWNADFTVLNAVASPPAAVVNVAVESGVVLPASLVSWNDGGVTAPSRISLTRSM